MNIILETLVSYSIGIFLDEIKDRGIEKVSELKLKKELETYYKQQLEENQEFSDVGDIDIVGLFKTVFDNQDVLLQCIKGTKKERESARASVICRSIHSSYATNKEAISRVKKIINNIISIIRHFYISKISIKEMASLALFSEDIQESIEESENIILENISSECKTLNNDISEKINSMCENLKSEIPQIVDEQIRKSVHQSSYSLSGMKTNSPLYIKEEFLFGREKDISSLIELCNKTSAIAITGFGGIGKTAVASVLFNRIKKNYDICAWIPYKCNAKISLCEAWDDDFSNIEEKWSFLSNKLKNEASSKLIVFDNVDSNPQIDQSPRSDLFLNDIISWTNTKVIITTREEQIDSFDIYRLNEIEKHSLIAMFKHYAYPSKYDNVDDEIEKIIERAYYHTFTVVLLAKAARHEADLGIFIKKLEAIGFSNVKTKVDLRLNEKGNKTITNHIKSLFDLTERNDNENRILYLFSNLPDMFYISESQIEVYFSINLDDINNLIEDGWLLFSNGKIWLHPLVKELLVV